MEDNECRDGGKKGRLANTPLSASQILTRILPSGGGDAENLQRILRLLTNYGVFSEHREFGGERKYSLTEIGKSLVTDAEGQSYAPYVLQHHQDALMSAWPLVHEAILDPTIEPFVKVHGEPTYSYYGKMPEMNGLMRKAMSGVSVPFMTSILDGYDGFKGVKRLVDVGGSAAPSIPGVTHIGGDMFKSIPAADAIFMKWVLTTWTDDECKLIMENCYKAIPAGGKLIACEPVLPDDSNESQRTRALLEGDIFVMTIYRAKAVLDGPPLPELLHYLGRFRIPLTRLAAFADFSTSIFLHEFCSGAHMRYEEDFNVDLRDNCVSLGGPSEKEKQISVFVEDEVETPEFPDEVGFIFSPRKASTCTSDDEAISANEANALPEFSRTPGIKTFHKDGFHDFGSARLDGENTWSVVSKEAKALVRLNENALCSSSSQPTCKANKSGKDAQKSRSPKLIAVSCKNVYIWKLDFTF
ncbi:methyltransferase 2 domain-containing protein [Citrus sinensis]|uniref:Methyltransferase 2 domain-containing protein n=1 Tax=Citrus sinensis TaxID=2711 RepID=A0ACB8KF63_CITSI|nr:methyltransferase 2 domain-containing protein [Citrus sinensis]